MKNPADRLKGQKGFTLIEIMVATLILTLLISAVIQYHTSSGSSKNQKYYLKAVQTAKTELEKLRALYALDSGATEFTNTGAPPSDKYICESSGNDDDINLVSPMYHVYYDDHGYGSEMLKPLREDSGSGPYSVLGQCSGVTELRQCYENAFNNATDSTDLKTFTYFTYDTNRVYPPDSSASKVDASVVVIDDMGSPVDPEDDLLGAIGWWVEDTGVISGTTYMKKVTFALQFVYPGMSLLHLNPETIVLKTTFVKP